MSTTASVMRELIALQRVPGPPTYALALRLALLALIERSRTVYPRQAVAS